MAELPGKRRMKGVGRVAFLAHRAEIEAELEAGWPIKAVYEKRADKLGISYQQFARYVDSIIRGGTKAPNPEVGTLPPAGGQDHARTEGRKPEGASDSLPSRPSLSRPPPPPPRPPSLHEDPAEDDPPPEAPFKVGSLKK